MEWAVPAFVLISGAIFLSPHKHIDYYILFNKYVKRIVFALLIFGLPMTFAETFLNTNNLSLGSTIFTGITNWIYGHSWAHMWYLYMLIGLYLITPIIKPFLNQAKNKEVHIALIVMFIISSIIPTLINYNIPITSFLVISTPFIFIYMLGYYLQWRVDYKQKSRNIIFSVTTLLICTISIIIRILSEISIHGYSDPACILMGASMFVLFKQLEIKSLIAEKLSIYCFGVYLIHTVFINALYKILHITPLNILGNTSPAITIPLFFMIFSIISFISVFILIKIPFFKKYIL